MSALPPAAHESPVSSEVSPTFRPPPVDPLPEVAAPRHVLFHVGLTVLTFLSSIIAYLMPLPSRDWSIFFNAVSDRQELSHAVQFSSAIMGILLVRGAASLWAARKRGMQPSLIFFLPIPLVLGTLGSVVIPRRPAADRTQLLRWTMAGVYAGFAASVIAVGWGLRHSTDSLSNSGGGPDFAIGSSILFGLLQSWFGQLPAESLVSLHPVAYAGWVGLFVTGMHLIPASQIDGGRIAYALFPRLHRILALGVVGTLLVSGALTALPNAEGGAHWGGAVWVFWSVVLFLVGLRPPPIVDERSRARFFTRLHGWMGLFILVLTFVPTPIVAVPETNPSIDGQGPAESVPSLEDWGENPKEEFRL